MRKEIIPWLGGICARFCFFLETTSLLFHYLLIFLLQKHVRCLVCAQTSNTIVVSYSNVVIIDNKASYCSCIGLVFPFVVFHCCSLEQKMLGLDEAACPEARGPRPLDTRRAEQDLVAGVQRGGISWQEAGITPRKTAPVCRCWPA